MKVKIEKLDHFGRGITKIDNKICFIENALPEEIVKVSITKDKKKIMEAKVDEYIEKSKSRINSSCPYSNKCGGCNLSHISFEDENKFKKQKLEELTNKFINYNTSIQIESDKKYNYRNKVVLKSKNNKLGFYQSKTNDIINIDKCLLANDKINEVITSLKKLDLKTNEITIRTSSNEEEVILILKNNIPNSSKLLNLADVVVVEDKVISNRKMITTSIGNKLYNLSPNSFFQINNSITEKTYNDIRKVIEKLNSKKVLDLYCGSGTIGIYIADLVDKVTGIETSISSIKDAKSNKELNLVNNINFIKGKVEDNLHNIKDIDTIIVDPPRAGLAPNVITEIKRINPVNIIYMSCDPNTMLRDVKELNSSYKITGIKGYNMFANTHHVECLVTLCRK